MPAAFWDHVHYQIANTPLRPYPFPHQYVRDVFPEPYYRELLERLPPIGAYQPIGETGAVSNPQAYRERMIVDVDEIAQREAERGERFWADFADWILGDGFRNLLLACWRPLIQPRLEGGARTFPQARLVRDLTNYALGPHTDSTSKLLSLLFYLPRDEANPHQGTSLYVPNEPAFRCKGGPHYRFEDFRNVHTFPYVRNALFLFPKSDVTFHGVERVRDADVERDVLQYNLYVGAVGD